MKLRHMKKRRPTRGGYDLVRPKDNIFRFLGFDRKEADRLKALSTLRMQHRDDATVDRASMKALFHEPA